MDGLSSAFLRDHQSAPDILYIEDFDAPPPPPRMPDIITPGFTSADLDAARESGRQSGLDEARGEQQAIQAALRTAALTAIGDALAAARDDSRAVARQMADELASTMLALLAASLPAAAAACAGGEIAALLEAVLPPLSREPDLRVCVHPSVLPDIAAAIEQTWPGHAARLTLTGDPALAASDCSVAWADGEARRDTAALWDAVRLALAPYRLPSLDTIMKGNADGQRV